MPVQSNDISNLVRRLVVNAYPELANRKIKVRAGALKSYGQVRWSDVGGINITCHQDVIDWPEPAIIGLLAHEISHPGKGQDSCEEATDLDVISRGLGHYLAVERAFVNKYEDHVVERGKDRYLGFQSIRDLLNAHEERILEQLLGDFRILPLKRRELIKLMHDTSIYDGTGHSVLMIEGKAIRVGEIPANSDLKLLLRDDILYVYADDEVIAEVPWEK
ncbi:MAG: hypothetical protein ACFFAX_08455 [Promethearchaeota archaeon]